MTHTPTPWFAVIDSTEDGNPPIWSIQTSEEIPDEEDNTIAGIWGTEEIDAANAAFIVRACNAHDDLVTAAERIIETMNGRVHSNGALGALMQLNKALAKARGEA